MCVPGTQGGQKSVSNTLGVELKMTVTHVDSENRTQDFWKSSQYSLAT